MLDESTKEVSAPKKPAARQVTNFGNSVLAFLSSVRFGVVLLCVLVAFCFLGMVIIQQNVNGFDAYYASRTPAERTVYGALGLFDIYHSWYFNFLLLILSLNIVLASIDRFGSAWSYIAKPKLWATRDFILRQKEKAEVTVVADSKEKAASYVANIYSKNGLRPTITEHKGNLYVFAQRGKWNRIGAYIVHAALLTLFLGHFVALWTGFDADVNMTPGETTSQIEQIRFNLDQKERFAVQLPFKIYCVDIQQKLIDPKGSIEVFNTLDWRTQIRIDDPAYGVTNANISLNSPFNYRGYRFFQAQTIPVGNAREMTLELTPENGGEKIEIKIARNGTVKLPDGTQITQREFLPDFTFNQEGKPDTKSSEYNNPVVVLEVTPPGGETERVFAFAANVDNIPVGAAKAGYKWKLKSYEKAPLAHVLSIKYDPLNGAFIAWYFGGIGLIFALVFVFFFSHKRIWTLIDTNQIGEGYDLTIGGDTNRNHFAFQDKFAKIIQEITGDEAKDNKQEV